MPEHMGTSAGSYAINYKIAGRWMYILQNVHAENNTLTQLYQIHSHANG